MAPNSHSNRVKDVLDSAPSVHISSLCPNGDGGCFACRQIRSLEREADEISKKLADVLERLTQAKSAANYAHSTMLAKLPNEILSHIFCASWEAVDPSPPRYRSNYEEPQEEKRLSAALILAGVCKKWRALALALPKIWTDIHVFVHRQKGDRALSILRDIVKRSKRAGLTIRLYSEPLNWLSRVTSELEPALAILQKESERWRALQMCIPYRLVKAFFEPNMDLSQVSFLYVHSNESEYMSYSDPLWKDKRLRPQRLSLAGPTMQNIDLFWDRVTHIVGIEFTIDQAMTIIRSAPLLTKLELMEADELPPVTGVYSRNFVHRNLQHLIYHADDRCSDGSVKSIFCFNIFSALTTVDYHTLFKTDEDPFLRHLIRNKPPIQELRLRGSPFDSSYVIRALRSIGSTLKRLDFEPEEEYQDGFEYDEFSRQLAAVNTFPPSSNYSSSDLEVGKQMFLSRLEYLKFSSGWPFAWDRVPAFFGSSSDPYRRPLKQFIFCAWGYHIIPEDDLISLIDLRKAGFVVESKGHTNVIQKSLEFYDLSTST